MKKLLLIDGNSIINRAFYGVGAANLRNADGLYTGAVHGFITIYNRVFASEKPDAVCVAFDVKAPTFRHLKYADYKAGRKPEPPELTPQFPALKEVLDTMKIARIEKAGFEADDIIGTLSLMAKEQGLRTVILTGDKDSLQLVDDKVQVILPITAGGQTTTTLMDDNAVFEKMGGWPRQVVDLKAIMGDKSDNIPGCPGIGEKGAAELLAKFDTLDGVFANLEKVEKPSMRSKLADNKELCYMSQWLATIDRHVPLDEFLPNGLDSLNVKEYDGGALYALFKKLEFRKLIQQMNLSEAKPEKKAKPADDGEFSLFDFAEKNEKASNITKVFNPDQLGVEAMLRAEKLCIICEGDSFTYFDGKNSVQVVFGTNPGKYIEKMKPVLENGKIEKIFYDAKLFMLACNKAGVKLSGFSNDLKICAYLADSTRRSDEYEPVSRFFAGEDKDAPECMPEVNEKALERIESDGMTMLLKEVELPLVSVLAKMESTGFKIDREALLESGKNYADNLEKLHGEIYALAGHEFNINSPKQLGEVLFDELKIGKGKKSAKGAYKTGVEVLEELTGEHPIVNLILDYRQNAKLKSTYIDGLIDVIDKETGKVYTTFNQTVTATGRLSSSEPNLQNIPVRHELGRVIREAFVADGDDHVIVDADYSQIELRLLAAMSGDETMINAFKNGIDIHALTAAQVNNVEPENVTKEMRSAAKAVNFGIVYGMSEYGLAKEIHVSVPEARRYISGYFTRFPKVSGFLESLKDFAKISGYAKTPFGRRRYLPEIRNSKYNVRQFGERVAMNMPIQGAAADLMKLAMVSVDREIEKRGLKAKIILQVHDELLLDAPSSEEEEVKELLKTCMENVAELAVPLTASVSSGKKWEK